MGYESKVIFKAVMDILKTSATLEEAMERIADVANVDEVIVTPTKKIKKDDSNAD
jgi:ribosomal protein S2